MSDLNKLKVIVHDLDQLLRDPIVMARMKELEGTIEVEDRIWSQEEEDQYRWRHQS